jgi:hypothetical protein
MADLDVDNAASFLIDQPLAEGVGSRAAIATPGKSWTYGELQALTDRAAQGLRRLGVEPEQRVALLMPDGVEFAAAFFADELSPPETPGTASRTYATAAQPRGSAARSRSMPRAGGRGPEPVHRLKSERSFISELLRHELRLQAHRRKRRHLRRMAHDIS